MREEKSITITPKVFGAGVVRRSERYHSQLSLRSARCFGAAVSAGEFLNPACGVDELLFAGEKRMACGTDTDFNVLTSGARMVDGAARANNVGFYVFRMDVRFHGPEWSAEPKRICPNSQVMKVSDPLLVAWAKTLERRQNGPAIFDETGAPVRTFRQVDDVATEFASRLAEFEPGAVVAVQIGNHPDWCAILLACRRRKLVVVPLDKSISEPDRAAALEVCHASGLISGDSFADGNGTNEPAISSLNVPVVAWNQRPPSLLKLTSGTTAVPRAVRFGSEQLIADCNQICDTMGIGDDDVNFGVIPISHSYGFSNLLTPLLVRGIRLVLSSDRLPRAIVRNLERSGATVFPGMPVFYQAFADMADVPCLPRLRLCISAGAPLVTTVARRFREKFELRIHSFYGSSECGGICYDQEGDTREEGFVGIPLIGVRLEPLDTDRHATQVRVHSAAVGDGYFPDPDDQQLANCTFTPDDLLSILPNGWRIVGRVSDVINVAGKKVNPAEVEAELLALPGVREAIVFGRKSSFRHQEVAACVVASSNVCETDLLKACRRRLSGWQTPKRIFMLDQLPVNERGKVSRRELGVRFAGE
jgi:long-chain acyl-CoA synthetase